MFFSLFYFFIRVLQRLVVVLGHQAIATITMGFRNVWRLTMRVVSPSNVCNASVLQGAWRSGSVFRLVAKEQRQAIL